MISFSNSFFLFSISFFNGSMLSLSILALFCSSFSFICFEIVSLSSILLSSGVRSPLFFPSSFLPFSIFVEFPFSLSLSIFDEELMSSIRNIGKISSLKIIFFFKFFPPLFFSISNNKFKAQTFTSKIEVLNTNKAILNNSSFLSKYLTKFSYLYFSIRCESKQIILF